jgi:GAF domain-containing protein
VPNTMLVVPLERDSEVIGVLSVLDRRDGGAYGPEDVARAGLFADLAVATLEPQSSGSQNTGPENRKLRTTDL